MCLQIYVWASWLALADSDWAKNHGNRSDMTAESMRDFAAEAGLSIKFQRLSGRGDGWGMDDLDCLSLLKKTD